MPFWAVPIRETLSDDLETLYRALYRDEKHCKVYLANSVWMREGVAFYESYTDNAAKRFYAECYTMDFDAPKAGRTISDRVSDKTKGLLKPEVTLKPETIAVLLNAVYFKANWIDEFQKKYTEQDAFTRADGSDVLCDFMQGDRSGRAVAAEGYCLAAIPFDGGFEMFFLLPDEGESIDGLLMSRDLAELLDGSAAEYRMVEWRVPKFTVQSQLDLVPVLRKLGVEQAFSDTAADFSAMCDVQQLGGARLYRSGGTGRFFFHRRRGGGSGGLHGDCRGRRQPGAAGGNYRYGSEPAFPVRSSGRSGDDPVSGALRRSCGAVNMDSGPRPAAEQTRSAAGSAYF